MYWGIEASYPVVAASRPVALSDGSASGVRTCREEVGASPLASCARETIRRVLEVVAAAVVGEDGLLLVSKHEAPDVFYLPGGKPDAGESPEACLRRELAEELGANATSLEPLDVVHALAALERVPMRMTVYRATLDRAPAAAAEISALRWYHPGEAFAGRLAPAVADHVIPALFAGSQGA
jgi:8-oxo-dGTP diphosphatase